MWHLSLILLVGLTTAEPQYSPPAQLYGIPIPKQCDPIRSVVYTTKIQQSVAFTTQRQVDTQVRTVTSYQDRIVATTLYQTQIKTQVQYQTSAVQRENQVFRETIVTQRQQGKNVFQTRYATTEIVVPQVSYINKERIQTQVVPVQRTNLRYETQYKDQVQYVTSQVVRTSVVQQRDQDVVRTVYRTQVQTSIVQRQGPAQTRYATTTLVRESVQVRSVPGQAVVKTNVVYSTRVNPTTQFRTRYEEQYVTRTEYVTRTNYQTQTQVRTQYVTQTVTVTKDVPREVVRTEYTTKVVPETRYQTRVVTQYNNPQPVIKTRVSYAVSEVQIPGRDQVVTREVVNTRQRQEVVYRTQIVPQQTTIYTTIQIPCERKPTGYNYQEPAISFKF